MAITDNIASMHMNMLHWKVPREKCLVIQDFLNIKDKLKKGKIYQTDEEEYFNRYWRMHFKRYRNLIKVNLRSRRKDGSPETSMHVNLTFYFDKDDGHPITKTIEGVYDDHKTSCGGCLLKMSQIPDTDEKFPHTVYFKVSVIKTWAREEKKRERHGADMSLTIKEVTFQMSKQLFASHSSQFQLLSQRNQRAKSELEELNRLVDPWDFGMMLEVIEGGEIDEWNIEGVLLLSRMYSVKLIERKCKQFLRNSEKISLAKKFQLAMQYGWEEIRDECVIQCTNSAEIADLVPTHLQTMGYSEALANWEIRWRNHLRNEESGDKKRLIELNELTKTMREIGLADERISDENEATSDSSTE